MPPFRELSRSGQAFVVATILAGVAALIVGLALFPLHWAVVPTLGYLAVGVQIAALMPIRWRFGTQTVHDPILLAAGLVAPGGGVALVAWLALYDGRRVGKDIPLWSAVFNRANYSIAHAIPSMLVTLLPIHGLLELPIKTLVYVLAFVCINYPLTAAAVAAATRTSALAMLLDNVGPSTYTSMVLLGLSGGILFELIQRPVGYLMAPGLFGFLIAVRGNVADAQRQYEERRQTLQLAAQALDARDSYTESHSARVADLAAQLGEALALGMREIDSIRTAGMLHDLGKIGVPDSVLNKQGPLDADEWAAMRRHPDIGADMISKHSALAPLAPLVRHHHERWDGSGYPGRLEGVHIPLGARVLAVADSYDTITGPRVYRRSQMSRDEAVDHLAEKAGVWYDPAVITALRAVTGLAGDPEGIREERRTALVRLRGAIGISTFGDALTSVALLIAVYATSRSVLAVAGVYVVQAGATLVCAALIGGLTDRVDRRRLLIGLDAVRTILTLALPLCLVTLPMLTYLDVALLAAAGALAQPTRQALIPGLASADLARVNARIAVVTTIAGVLGYPVSALLLWAGVNVDWLFVIDSATFALSALIVWDMTLAASPAGSQPLKLAVFRAVRSRELLLNLGFVACAATAISFSFPALIALAYGLSDRGGQTYAALETILAAGMVLGSLAVGRWLRRGSLSIAALGIAVTGVASVSIWLLPNVWTVAGLLLVASVGNAAYSVASTTSVMQLAESSRRGAVMVARFAVTQVALTVGAALGGYCVLAVGAAATYAVLGAVLVVIAVVTLLASQLMRQRGGLGATGVAERA